MRERYSYHTLDSAPKEARPTLQKAIDTFGMLPNLTAKMATSPALVEGYLTLSGIFDRTSLSPVERQVVLLASSRRNVCTYCMGAHSVLADMVGMPAAVTDAIRNDQPIPDPKLEALRRFTTCVVDTRGRPQQLDLDPFFSAGYGPQQVLDVILGVGLKTLSNYTNHIAGTELDDAFASRAWEPNRGCDKSNAHAWHISFYGVETNRFTSAFWAMERKLVAPTQSATPSMKSEWSQSNRSAVI